MTSTHPFVARPHQQVQVDAAVANLQAGGRTSVVMACGTGKTLVAQRVTEQVAGGVPLVLAVFPNLGLLSQNARNWQLDSTWAAGPDGAPFRAFAFCSDSKVGVGADDITLEAADLSVPATTDPGELFEWISAGSGPVVVFATYQSTPALVLMHQAHSVVWSMVVCDEAHRTAGPSAGAFATVLDDAKIPAVKRLFLTATPRVHTGKANSDGETRVISMDDTDLYGQMCPPLTYKAAVDLGLLQPFDVAAVCISDSDLLGLARGMGYDTVEATGLTAGDLAIAITSLRAAKDHDAYRQLVFHPTIARSKAYAKDLARIAELVPATLRTDGDLTARHIQGGTKASERTQYLTELNNTVGVDTYVVSNVKCLTEGIDVPNLDAVVFAAPKSSTVDIVQAIGRISRKGARVEPALVIVPVYVGSAENVEAAIETSAFGAMYKTVQAVADIDSVVDQRFTDFIRGERSKPIVIIGKGGNDPEPGNWAGPTIRILQADDERDWTSELADKLTLAFAKQAGHSWEMRLAEAVAWRGEHGRDARKEGHDVSEDEKRSGRWLATQRQAEKNGEFSTERIEALDRELPDWRGTDLDQIWSSSLDAAVAWRAGHGWDARKEGHNVSEGEKRIGRWLSSQRHAEKNGKLSNERLAALDRELPDWRGTDLDQIWSSSLDAAVAFWVEHGRNARMNRSDASEDEKRTGRWLANQRQAEKNGKLSNERLAALDRELPDWRGTDLDQLWRDSLAAAVAWRAERGQVARVTASDASQDEMRIGRWLGTQRKVEKRGELSTGRIAALDRELPDWRGNDQMWRDNLGEAVAFRSEHGRNARKNGADVSEGEKRIGNWLSGQRRTAKTDKLLTERLAALDAELPDWRG